jgi:hypothetical protein
MGEWHPWIEYRADRADRPVWTDDLPAAERVAYGAGYAQALALAAERTAELDAVWGAAPRRTWAERVAERVALFERCAAELAAEMGRPPGWRYDGGPVHWRSGRARRRLEAVA